MTLQAQPTDDIPTTVNDFGEERAASPLKKYKLSQNKIDNGSNCPPAMLSPREPRTLVDLMQPLGNGEAGVPNASTSPIKELSSPLSTTQITPILVGEQLSPRKPVLNDGYSTPSYSDFSHHSGTKMAAARSIDLGYPQALKRSVSMMEDIRRHSSIWNGHENLGGNQVHDALHKEPCGSAEYAPVTPPPSKKKVRVDCVRDFNFC